MASETRNGSLAERLPLPRGQRWVLGIAGVASIVAGFIALFMPFLASLTLDLVAGIALIVSGGIGAVAAFRDRTALSIAASFALSLLSVGVGVVLLVMPLLGIVALATLILAYLIASGGVRVWYGIKMRGEEGWIWLTISGALAVVLGVFIALGLPVNALWVPGVFLAVDLLFNGAMLLAVATAKRREADGGAGAEA